MSDDKRTSPFPMYTLEHPMKGRLRIIVLPAPMAKDEQIEVDEAWLRSALDSSKVTSATEGEITWGEDQDPDFVDGDNREPGGKIDHAPRPSDALPDPAAILRKQQCKDPDCDEAGYFHIHFNAQGQAPCAEVCKSVLRSGHEVTCEREDGHDGLHESGGYQWPALRSNDVPANRPMSSGVTCARCRTEAGPSHAETPCGLRMKEAREGLPSVVRFVLQKYEMSSVGHHDPALADALEAMRSFAVRTEIAGMPHETSEKGADQVRVESVIRYECMGASESDIRTRLTRLFAEIRAEERAAPRMDKVACTCGSGAHPRRCEVHPLAYDTHVADFNAAAKDRETAYQEGYDAGLAVPCNECDRPRVDYACLGGPWEPRDQGDGQIADVCSKCGRGRAAHDEHILPENAFLAGFDAGHTAGFNQAGNDEGYDMPEPQTAEAALATWRDKSEPRTAKAEEGT